MKIKIFNKKFIISLATSAFATIAIATNTFASGLTIESGDKTKIYDANSNKQITDKLMPVINVIMYLITVALVIIAIIKGLQYMNSVADPEAKAKTKKELIYFVAGAAIVFGITQILNIIANAAQNSIG